MSKSQQPTASAPSDGGVHYCQTCQRGFVSADALGMHRWTSKVHQAKQAVSSPSVSSTEKSKTSSAKPGHICYSCDKPFKNKAALRQHKKDSPKHQAAVSGNPQDRLSRATTAPPSPPKKKKGTGPAKGALETTTGGSYGAEQLSSSPYLSRLSSFTPFIKGDPDVCIGLANAFAAQRIATDRPAGLGLAFQDDPVEDYPDVSVASVSTEDFDEDANPESDYIVVEVPAPWSSVSVSERHSVLSALPAQCHSIERLKEEHYWTVKPSATDIDMTRKCNNCGAAKRKLGTDSEDSVCRFHPAKKPFERGIIRGRGSGVPKTARCVNCPKLGPSGGCIVLPTHDFAAPDAKLREMARTPVYSPNARQAVVLDCEMIGVLGANNRESSEVVRVSAVDFVTGEVLVDTYVSPQGHVISWRTKFSGVNAAILREKEREGKVITGWRAARDLLWQFVDARTVLIGHSLNNDLAVLGMVHTRVVDSAIMTRLAVGEDCQRHWALKVLVQQFLGLEIQTGNDGHDCLEDTYATREAVLWCLRNPSKLQDWAADERELIAQKKKAKEAALAEVAEGETAN
ncbi:hypothetical protein BJY00DRAFT_280453 [Aspergillus carlsbadensis]|nr:hypothetical protein BJY00DRAFT_280453 [Aspergillus carlsbadensis]